MKVKRISNEPLFTPFSFTITVETRHDAQALYAIFNLWDNKRLIGAVASDAVKSVISSDYYVSGDDKVIANGVTYKEYYQLRKVVKP